MSNDQPRILLYLLRHDVRLSDNPVFHFAAHQADQLQSSTTSLSDTSSPNRNENLTSKNNDPNFTHLLPVYVFPANQIEVSGFLASSSDKSPYPEARSPIAGVWRTGPHRVKFIAEGVWDLKQKLESLECGSGLEIRVGTISDVASSILKWYSRDGKDGGKGRVTDIWMTEEFPTEEKDDENAVRKIAEQNDVNFKLWQDEKYYIDDRDLPFKDIRELPNVYTTYRKSVEPLRDGPRKALPAPTRLPPLPAHVPPQDEPFKIPSSLENLQGALTSPFEKDPAFGLVNPPTWPSGVKSAHPFDGGEAKGQARISHLISSGAMSSYKATRNGMLGLDFSTKISAYLAQGHITARQVHWAMVEFEEGRGEGKSVQSYGKGENEGTAAVRFELLWRDYFRLCMKKFGHRMFHIYGIQDRKDQKGKDGSQKSYQKKWKRLRTSSGSGDDAANTFEAFTRFRSGRTGIGLIDASNRELFVTGYTSNRARQNVASFLSSHLDIDWRVGAEWYESFLIDYDPASNWGNWQYVAGVGNDPRQGRVFNPVKQALDYDPQGEYIKAWVPELRGIQLTRTTASGKEETDPQKLMGLYQAWRLSDWEKHNLGLNGVEWVEHPLKRIQFSVGRGRGGQGDNRARRGGSGGGGSWRGRGRGQERNFRRRGNEERSSNNEEPTIVSSEQT